MRALLSLGGVTTIGLSLAFAPAVADGAHAERQAFYRPWVAIGIGLSPSPYELDANGSPLGDVAFGRGVSRRVSMVGTATHLRMFGSTPAQFTNVSVSVRSYLSKVGNLEGGPYAEIAPTVCHARYRDRGVSDSRVLPGLELGVGTVIPLSASIAMDWRASHVITPDAEGFSPSTTTHETKRDGLDRGTVRIRLVLRR